MRSTMRTLYNQGGVPRFYQGIAFAMFQGPLARFGATAANEGMLQITKEMSIDTPMGLAAATAGASVAAGLWRLFIIPLDTCKTLLQVEGPRGFRTVMRRVHKPTPSACHHHPPYTSCFPHAASVAG